MLMRILFIVLPLVWLSPVSAMAVESPLELVQTTTEKLLAELKADQNTIHSHPDKIYSLVADIVLPHFDFERMAQLSLGKYWRQLSPQQRERFVSEFRLLLVRTYGTALADYNDQQVEYKPLRMNDNDERVTIKTEIKQAGSPPIPVDYSLYRQDGQWKVYDIVIDGISLVTNYRASFAASFRSKGAEGLIEELVARNRPPGPAVTEAGTP